jgi:spore coat protein U-like protein
MSYLDGDLVEHLLTYNLYIEGGEAADIWGAGVGAKGYTGNGSEQELTIYGRVDSGQTDAVSGAEYSDIVNVSYTF